MLSATNYVDQAKGKIINNPGGVIAICATDTISVVREVGKLGLIITLVYAVASLCLGNDVRKPLLCVAFTAVIWLASKKFVDTCEPIAKAFIAHAEKTEARNLALRPRIHEKIK